MNVLPRIFDSDDRRLLRDTVRSYLASNLSDERVRQLDENGAFPREVWNGLGRLGLLGIGVPEALGGSGGSLGESVIVTLEIARRFPSLAVDYVLCGMVARMLSEPGSGVRPDWLAGLSSGSQLFAYAISEPDGGTDALALKTRAEETPAGWALHGNKLWISLADLADTIFVLARTDPPDRPERKAHGLSLIAVTNPQPRMQITRVPLAGMRCARTCAIFMDGALAPLDALVGERGKAMSLLRGTLNAERILAAALSVGMAVEALEMAVAYAGQREAFGRPIGSYQALQHRLADVATQLTAVMLLLERATSDFETGHDVTTLAVMAKVAAAEAVSTVVDCGMRTMAAAGLATESRMQMFFRDGRLQLFSPISNEMARNVIGERMGLPRSY